MFTAAWARTSATPPLPLLPTHLCCPRLDGGLRCQQRSCCARLLSVAVRGDEATTATARRSTTEQESSGGSSSCNSESTCLSSLRCESKLSCNGRIWIELGSDQRKQGEWSSQRGGQISSHRLCRCSISEAVHSIDAQSCSSSVVDSRSIRPDCPCKCNTSGIALLCCTGCAPSGASILCTWGHTAVSSCSRCFRRCISPRCSRRCSDPVQLPSVFFSSRCCSGRSGTRQQWRS